MVVLNFIAPLIEGIAYEVNGATLFCHTCPFFLYRLTTQVKVLSKYAVGLLQITSGVFLAVGILKIRQLIQKRGSSTQLNVCQLVLHISAFSLYLFSVTVLYTFYTEKYIHESYRSTQFYYGAEIFYNACSFISQLCLISILWTLGGEEAP